MARPFRFGVSVRGATSLTDIEALARRAEDAGYHTLLMGDHLALGLLAPFPALVAAAGVTDRLRVGTFVLNNDFRHPALVAREAATVDRLSGGRFELGLGAGHMQSEYEEVGLAYDPAAVRVARMAEAAALIGGLLAGEQTYDGRHYRVREHRLYPPPTQAHMPFLIGGNGRGVLATAARVADIVGFTGFSYVPERRDVDLTHFTDAGLAEQIGWVKAAAGARFDDLELNVLVQDVRATPSPEAEDIGLSPYLLTGSVADIADQLLERRERLGVSYITVFEKDADAFAAVIERLS